MIEITEPAQKYLVELLGKQEKDVLGVRIFINDPGTPRAETCISYCREDDCLDDDEQSEYEGFRAWVAQRSLPFLEAAVVDYEENAMGGQLTIRAPNARMPQVSEDSPIEDRINYVIYNEINPALAAHSGEVALVQVVKEKEGKVAVLRFGGSCQGCGMIDVTLRQGVEKTLMTRLPELGGVRDITDHSDRSRAYY